MQTIWDIVTKFSTFLIREGFIKKQDKLGLLAEPPLTPPPNPNFGPVIWFENIFSMFKT